MADLHNDIMNLPCDYIGVPSPICAGEVHAYKLGHRDARHAAAEIATTAIAAKDADIIDLHRSVAGAVQHAAAGWARYEEANADRNAVHAERVQLVERITALEAENDEMRGALADKVTAATMFNEIAVRNGGLHLGLEGGMCHLLAEGFADQFREQGGVNFLEMEFTTKEGQRLLVTLQNTAGKTPARLKAEAEARCVELEAQIAELSKRPSADTMLTTARKLMAELSASDEEDDVKNLTARGIGYLHSELLSGMADAKAVPGGQPDSEGGKCA